MAEVFECEIQARLRDVNLGGHVDNVEAIRVLDEARLLFLRFVPFQPFLVRLWVSHVGRSSFSVASELRVEVGHDPALVAETTMVLWDGAAGRAWAIDGAVRQDLTSYAGAPAALRARPSS